MWFRKREDLTVLGAGFGISRATAYRYRDEAVDVHAAQAPKLTEALDRVQAEGWSHGRAQTEAAWSRSPIHKS